MIGVRALVLGVASDVCGTSTLRARTIQRGRDVMQARPLVQEEWPRAVETHADGAASCGAHLAPPSTWHRLREMRPSTPRSPPAGACARQVCVSCPPPAELLDARQGVMAPWRRMTVRRRPTSKRALPVVPHQGRQLSRRVVGEQAHASQLGKVDVLPLEAPDGRSA